MGYTFIKDYLFPLRSMEFLQPTTMMSLFERFFERHLCEVTIAEFLRLYEGYKNGTITLTTHVLSVVYGKACQIVKDHPEIFFRILVWETRENQEAVLCGMMRYARYNKEFNPFPHLIRATEPGRIEHIDLIELSILNFTQGRFNTSKGEYGRELLSSIKSHEYSPDLPQKIRLAACYFGQRWRWDC
jgi:hypothetical protein